MKDKMTPMEFAQKCEWEGGSLISGFDYGLRSKDLDDSDPRFKELVREAEEYYERYDLSWKEIYNSFPYFDEVEQ